MLTGMKAPDTNVSYTYDEIGRRTSMIDDHGKTAYSYRAADGMLNGLTFPDGTKLDYENNTQQRLGYTLTGAKGQSLRIHGELDSMNRVTSMDITSGTGGASALAASAATPVDRMTFSYASNSLLENVLFGQGLSTSYQFGGYDLSGVEVSQGGATVHQFNYIYDGNKNITSRTQNGETDQFTYDELSRIQTESGTQQETYTYDQNGNRYSTGSGKVYGLKDATYAYDSQNRLVKASGEGKTVLYSYNGDGLLYERTEGDQTTRYYYDEEAKLMAEASVTSGKAELTYAYIYDLYGQLWARQDKQTGKLEYYQLNGHGDVVGLVDDSGQVLNSYTYDIWGGPLTWEETVPNVLRYAGEYWDETVGLQYLRARWYDPGMARFIGEDTYEGELNDPLSLNLYSYVHNNPLKFVDPSGHAPIVGDSPYDTVSPNTVNRYTVYVTKKQLTQLGFQNITNNMVKDLNVTLGTFDITTNERVSHFLAQVMQESELGRWTTELGGKKYFSKYEPGTKLGKQLGNKEKGDGYKFRGAGYIQMTGRYNYQRFADAMGDPKIMKLGAEYVAENYAWRAAGFWWDDNKMNKLVDSGASVTQVTKRVNGGTNHLANRKKYYTLVKKILR
ncbi:RHS repeat-associated core domain-containing protein [Paenibacillus sp. QZ-Y1]|uniref:RHS repeat-associated core domain-containing protein n=1 Tax=Paenibacillus sp. QZ-Y1 TaxID=3414511 RepID=UPI003F7A6F49